MNNPRNLVQVNFNFGMVYYSFDSALAEDYFTTALSYAKDSKSAAYLIPRIFQGLGYSAFTQANYSKAHEYFCQSFSKYFNRKITDPQWLPPKKDLELIYIRDKSSFLEVLKVKAQTYMAQAKKENY